MKVILFSLFAVMLYGCAETTHSPASPELAGDMVNDMYQCSGSARLPDKIADNFQAVSDPKLLAETLGAPEQGKLCQGAVYQSKSGTHVTLFRAWNSTNPGSKFGKWWAWQKPAGPIAKYRADYEICYQWSPLDVMVRCTLKPETKIVVGNGQSARCSEYLTYPTSGAQQIFLPDAESSLTDCQTFTGVMQWQ
ncbi:hypothetical protein [Vibrio mangrovi]|uniref:Lipoprotein n=1 Tax=Vibrio mangrovi TaxID=474394 RepID=A0A1Y6ITE0_9VIBR|nr:hypothetical protein [Vibrio mangrovi]MDW6004607.1 hypothetical protein [Vibrio mangrovi]SMS00896.1 hypothetical protein VIM7927_02169 [Vibrio mangrovi]